MPIKMQPPSELTADLARRLRRGDAVLESNLLLLEITPPRLTPRLKAFCSGISSEMPIFVKQEAPLEVSPTSVPVGRRIIEAGGSSLLGWAVKCVPGIWASAECRTIWVSPSGEAIDLRSDASDGDQTMFIPDASIPVGGRSYKVNERLLVEERETTASNALIAALSAEERAAYQSFGRQNGLTLAQTIRMTMNIGGPIARGIDHYLKERGALDAMLEVSPNGDLVLDPHQQDVFARHEAVQKMKQEILTWAGAQLRSRLNGKLLA